MVRVADYIIDTLYRQCAEHVFTVTGRGILFLTDAVAKHEGMQCISVHNEQAGAYSAIAYANYTGKSGICLVSTGCAATNAITGLMCAWQDGIPCVFLSGQNMLNETTGHTGLPIRTYGSQELNIIPVVQSLTKYAVMLTDPSRVVYELEKAIYLSQNGKKGPVWVDVPLDIQNARIEPEELERFVPPASEPATASSEALRLVREAFAAAERPVILIGSGVRSAQAELAQLVERYHIPLTFAHSATDLYGTAHPLSIGAVGAMYGTRAGNFAVQNADLLLVIGCRMTSMTTGADKDKFARHARTIVIDIDESEFRKQTMRVDQLILADAKMFLNQLLSMPLTPASKVWQGKAMHWKSIFPTCEEHFRQAERVDLYQLAEALSQALPDQSAVISDAGIEELIIPTNVVFRDGMRCIHPAMQGAMGFALPAAVGVQSAAAVPVTVVVGDGSIMMNLQEMETIRHNRLPIKIFVVSNNMYAVIRKRQVELFRARTIGTDPENGVSCPDFKMVADCFGLQYVHITCSTVLLEEVKKVFAIDGAVLCEIDAVDTQEYMRDGYARNAQKRIVHRPIEDQEPFLDRTLFLSEMLVDPIDQ